MKKYYNEKMKTDLAFIESSFEKIKAQNLVELGENKIEYNNPHYLLSMVKEIFIEQKYFFKSRNKKPFIVDCGSNIGISILFFKLAYPNSNILAFEPEPSAFKLLKKNLINNGIKGVELQNKALALVKTKKRFYFDKKRPASVISGLNKKRSLKSYILLVPERLSDYISCKVDFLKLDIEGSELEVLNDLVISEKINFIEKMIIEYHHHINKEEDKFSELLLLLENSNFGYQIEGKMNYPLRGKKFQDILVYAYKKRCR